MSAKGMRILKEARPLFWPWCAVAAAGALSLFPQLHSIYWIGPAGSFLGIPVLATVAFFLGIPLLATLSFGNEFQHQTISMLLSQPAGRMEIWGEKLSVTAVSVLAAVLVFSVTLGMTPLRPEPQLLALGGAWVLATIASAPFWTLVARSTLGGVALNFGVSSLALNLVNWIRVGRYPAWAYAAGFPVFTVGFLVYAVVMLWLGRRRLAGFQAAGGMAGDDLLTAGPDVMPGTLAGWLRCRPSGVVLNLFRKEFRLLRPVWLLTLLAAVSWACLALAGLRHGQGPNPNLETAAAILGVSSTLLIAILAGSLSLGEERTTGTHAWHMTLPARALLQWRIKLYVALLAGFVGAGVLPTIAIGSLFGVPRSSEEVAAWLLFTVLLTFAAFWCACAVQGTVRAVLWMVPVFAALVLASELGQWTGGNLIGALLPMSDSLGNAHFIRVVGAILDPDLFDPYTPSSTLVRYVSGESLATLALLWGPTLLVAVIQSYRLFRGQNQGSTKSLARNLLPLALTAFLCSLSLRALLGYEWHAWEQRWSVLRETLQAVDRIRPTAAKLQGAHPLEFTAEDLAKASPLSDLTRRWLRGSRVTIAPLKVVPGQQCCGGTRWSSIIRADDPRAWYLDTIYLAGGSNCTRAFQHWNRDAHVFVVICGKERVDFP